MVIGELLSSVGIRGELLIVIAGAYLAFRLFRWRRAAASAGGTLSTVWLIIIAVVLSVVVGTLLGWWDPNPSTIMTHLATAADWVVEVVGGLLADALAEVTA
jgi:ABC-type amino acid transport system permease subunit